MRSSWRGRLKQWLRLLRLSAMLVAGRRFWIVIVLPLAWVGFQVLRLFIGWRPDTYAPVDAQSILIGTPLAVLGIGLGVRIMAAEIDQRTLEIAYTVPGGAHRVWLAKLAACLGILIAAETLLALATFFFCTSFPLGALYGALQAAMFYMAAAMGLSAISKSEATGGLLAVGLLIFNIFVQGANFRISPFFNPIRLDDEAALVLARTVQNRIGFVLVIAVIILLAFGRAERREKMLGG